MEYRPADPGAPADSISLFLVSVLGMEHAWWHWCPALFESVLLSISLCGLHPSPWCVALSCTLRPAQLPTFPGQIVPEESGMWDFHFSAPFCEFPSLGNSCFLECRSPYSPLQTTEPLWAKTSLPFLPRKSLPGVKYKITVPSGLGRLGVLMWIFGATVCGSVSVPCALSSVDCGAAGLSVKPALLLTSLWTG